MLTLTHHSTVRSVIYCALLWLESSTPQLLCLRASSRWMRKLTKLNSPKISVSPRLRNSEISNPGPTFTRLFCRLAAPRTSLLKVSAKRILQPLLRNWRQRTPLWKDGAILESTHPSHKIRLLGSAKLSATLISTRKVVLKVRLSHTPSM